MIIAVDVRHDLLQRAMKLAGTDSPDLAVAAALREFVRKHDQSQLIQYLGTFEDLMTREELDNAREMD